jgi:UDP-2,3-diacylglucosamine pyrophosphatase LpxH
MRTVILSDTHLGNGQGYDIFAGAAALPGFLRQLAAGPPVRVVFNGDSVDFLMNEDPLSLDVARAVRQARAIAESPASAAVLEALGHLLARGSEVMVRLGNHDIELALPEVQAVFYEALRQPDPIAARLRFVLGDEPTILVVGGARVLLGHGEQNDPWNQVDYPALKARPVHGAYPDYRYAPGSRLVKTLLNPLKRQYGMRFADLLKPDFQGGALTALAVDPAAVKVVFKGGALEISG